MSNPPLTPQHQRFDGYYQSAAPKQHVNWRIDAKSHEGSAFLEMHITRCHVGGNRTSQMLASAHLVPADARRLALAVCPALGDAVDALRRARQTVNDLNSAYGSDAMQAVVDECDAAIAKAEGKAA